MILFDASNEFWLLTRLTVLLLSFISILIDGYFLLSMIAADLGCCEYLYFLYFCAYKVLLNVCA